IMDVAGAVRSDVGQCRNPEHAKGDARESGFNETHGYEQIESTCGGTRPTITATTSRCHPKTAKFGLRFLPPGSCEQFPAAIRATALHGRTAIRAERAFLGTDTGGVAVGRKGCGQRSHCGLISRAIGIAPFFCPDRAL